MTTGSQAQAYSRLEWPARWAALAAFLCGIHCLVTPFVVTAIPILALSKATEWWALGVTVVLGGGITLLGPARQQGTVLGLLAAGAGIWAASLMGLLEPIPEFVTSPLGSLVFASGMLWSARICRKGACDVCEADSVQEQPAP